MPEFSTGSPRAFQQPFQIVLNPDELQTLASWQPRDPWTTDFRDSIAIQLMSMCGLRRAEVVNLLVCQIQIFASVPWLVDFVGKGSYRRSVPLPSQLYRRLVIYISQFQLLPPDQVIRQTRAPFNRLSPHQLYLITRKRTAELLGYPVRCHLLRHSIATAWLRSGVDIKTVQTLLGHRSLSSTSRYLHTSADSLVAAVQSISPDPQGRLFFKEVSHAEIQTQTPFRSQKA